MWILGDHLGSTSITVDATSNTKLSERRYKPWGELRYEWGDTGTKYAFTGQRAEMDGLYDYGARFYDSSIMQFNQPDTLIPDPYNPLDWNRYSYVRNNPIKYTDPTGHCIWDVCISEAIFVTLALAATTVGVSSYYATGGPDAVADAITSLGEQVAEIADEAANDLRSLVKNAESQQSTDEKDKLSVPLPNSQTKKKALSPNQLNQQIKKGKAPRGITRVDTPKVKNEQEHVHFGDDVALNKDGTWKHGEIELTNAQIEWLLEHGWTIPE